MTCLTYPALILPANFSDAKRKTWLRDILIGKSQVKDEFRIGTLPTEEQFATSTNFLVPNFRILPIFRVPRCNWDDHHVALLES
jgi:hypothetical protein